MFENFDWIGAMRTSPVMLVILGCSILTLGFALERATYFFRRRGSPEGVMRALLEKVRGGHLKEAPVPGMDFGGADSSKRSPYVPRGVPPETRWVSTKKYRSPWRARTSSIPGRPHAWAGPAGRDHRPPGRFVHVAYARRGPWAHSRA